MIEWDDQCDWLDDDFIDAEDDLFASPPQQSSASSVWEDSRLQLLLLGYYPLVSLDLDEAATSAASAALLEHSCEAAAEMLVLLLAIAFLRRLLGFDLFGAGGRDPLSKANSSCGSAVAEDEADDASSVVTTGCNNSRDASLDSSLSASESHDQEDQLIEAVLESSISGASEEEEEERLVLPEDDDAEEEEKERENDNWSLAIDGPESEDSEDEDDDESPCAANRRFSAKRESILVQTESDAFRFDLGGEDFHENNECAAGDDDEADGQDEVEDGDEDDDDNESVLSWYEEYYGKPGVSRER
jgi:hypothetical protein